MREECFVLASHNKAKLIEMRDILGEPLYDKDQTVQGIPLTVFEYPEVKVGVVKATGQVADIALSGKDYEIPGLSIVDRISDRFFTILYLNIFSFCFKDSCLDIIHNILRLFKTWVI